MTEWSEKDRGLAVGLLALEDSTVLGVPASVAFDDESDGHLVAVPRVNHAQAAIDRAREQDKKPAAGTEYFVADLRVNPEYDA